MSLSNLRRYATITVGCLIYAIAFNWCFAPTNISYGGFTGVAQIIHAFLGFPSIGVTVFLMNIPLFLAGWKLLGGSGLVSNLYGMAVSSLFVDLVATLHPFQPMDLLLSSIYGGVLQGVGIGTIVACGASTGGTDLLARLLKFPFPWLPMGKLLMVLDLAVISSNALVFRELNNALYGLIALYISTTVMDTVLYGLDKSKVAYIISDHYKEIAQAILDLERGVTLLQATGGWSGEEKQVLMVALSQREIVQIKKLVHELDERAFLIVCDAHEVLGEGFREYKKDDI